MTSTMASRLTGSATLASRARLPELLGWLLDAGILADVDVWPIWLVARRLGVDDEATVIAATIACRAPRLGHVGDDLCGVAAELAALGRPPRAAGGRAAPAPLVALAADPAAWAARLRASSLCGPLHGDAPLAAQLLSDGRDLFMTRAMAREQQRVAAALRQRALTSPSLALTTDALSRAWAALDPQGARFAGGAEPRTDEGLVAVAAAATSALTVVTGGPGTGKTFSVMRTLALLWEACGPGLHVALAAPTGKAAVRMREAIAESLAASGLVLSDRVREELGRLEAVTLHRLLGVRPDGSVLHGPRARLGYDVVVVDEASMIDLVLMRMLLEAVRPDARLLMLGDRDQLTSVEAGTVLADIVAAAGPVASRVVRFGRSRRFASAPTIAAIAGAVQSADDRALAFAVRLLCRDEALSAEPEPERVRWLDREARSLFAGRGDDEAHHDWLLDQLAAPYEVVLWAPLATALLRGGLAAVAEPPTQQALLLGLERYRVLATHREGRRGVAGLREALESRARAAIAAAAPAQVRAPQVSEHWLGRPLLITRNDRSLQLANGDVGLVLPAGPTNRLHGVFLTRQGACLELRAVPLAQLPPHEGAIAMTVHKSQGSQFEEVGLVLFDGESPIQTRELVYTGITRAARRLRWSGGRETLQRALARPVRRASGLGRLLGDET